jgi:hypothetical protein
MSPHTRKGTSNVQQYRHRHLLADPSLHVTKERGLEASQNSFSTDVGDLHDIGGVTCR